MSWQMHNLTQASQALKAIDEPASHVVQGEGTQHVFHRADLGGQETIVELWWSDGAQPAGWIGDKPRHRALVDRP